MTSLWDIFALGFLLGIRHAFDADHLVAVSTIVSEYRNPLRAIWIGISWGLGHTTTLFLVGLLILLVKIPLPEQMSVLFESLVGLVLVVLGLQIFWSFRRGQVHLHTHQHPGQEHQHFHSHAASPEHRHHPQARGSLISLLIAGIVPGEHNGQRLSGLRPFFRVKSYVVGIVHGLAGSAALMLLVLATMQSRWAGVAYILLFGLGSLVSMGVVTIFISLPFSASARLPGINRAVQGIAGALGILFGLFLIYEGGVVQRLLGAG